MKRTMKKIYAFMVAAIALGAVACNNEAIDEVVGGENIANGDYITTLTVSLDNTRTELATDGKTTWCEGDEISLNGSVFELTDAAAGTFSLKEGQTAIAKGLSGYTVLYPANTTTIPATQTATAGSFAHGAALLKAVVTSDAELTNLSLDHAHALLKFTVAADATSVSVLGYTLEGTITAGQTYYLAVPAATYSEFAATVDGTVVKSTTNVTLANGQLLNLKTLPVASDYAIIGTHANNWDFSATTRLFDEGGDYYVARNISGMDEYKFVNASATGWGASVTYNYGAESTLAVCGGARIPLSKDSANNLKVGDSSVNYDVYLAKDSTHSFVIETGVEIPEHKVTFIGSNGNWENDVLLLPYNANWSVAKNVTITSGGFLLRLNYGWDTKWGNAWPNEKDVSKCLGIEYNMNKGYDNAEWSGSNTACDVYVKNSTIGGDTTTIYVVNAGTAVEL